MVQLPINDIHTDIKQQETDPLTLLQTNDQKKFLMSFTNFEGTVCELIKKTFVTKYLKK